MSDISVDLLKQFIAYDAQTGECTWVKEPRFGIVAGSRAGFVSNGYWRIRFKGKNRAAHRIGWALTTGEWPNQQLDHVNGDKLDNRLSNLRLCSNGQNQRNTRIRSDNKSGIKGVSIRRYSYGVRYRAQVAYDGTNHFLGEFRTIEEAASKYRDAAKRLHGEFWNDGTQL